MSSFCEVPFELAGREEGPRRWRNPSGTRETHLDAPRRSQDRQGRALSRRNSRSLSGRVAKQEGFEGLLTISNQLVSVYGRHPIDVDGRRYRSVSLHHLSWVQNPCYCPESERSHRGRGLRSRVDPQRAHQVSPARAVGCKILRRHGSRLESSGPHGLEGGDASARGRGREQTSLCVGNSLLQHISLSLAARLGGDVHPVLSRREAQDPSIRNDRAHQVGELATLGTLSRHVIAIPNTVAPIDRHCEPEDDGYVRSQSPWMLQKLGRSTTRLNWLLRPAEECTRLALVASMAALSDTSSGRLSVAWRWCAVIRRPYSPVRNRPPRSFTVAQTGKIGTKRRTGSGQLRRTMWSNSWTSSTGRLFRA